MIRKCRYCGYESTFICDGLGPRMGCPMPGQQPGYRAPTEQKPLFSPQTNDKPVFGDTFSAASNREEKPQ
jgi:hypothetical protein